MTETKSFYNSNIGKALIECQDSGYKALFMPELANLRIDSPKDAEAWENWYTTPSIRATGRTKSGSRIVLYAHTDNYFSNPDNIRKSISQGLIRGAGKMPQEEFQRLADLAEQDDKQVFLVPYETLKKSKSGLIDVDDALDHPQVIPFLGGKEIAEKYLENHKKVCGNRIGVWHSDDLGNEPLARLLYLGDGCNGGLGGDGLDGSGRFLGVRKGGIGTVGSDARRENLESKIKMPALKQILDVSKPFVAEASRQDFEDKIRKLYE